MSTKICRHIRTNGRRCGSPALTDAAFCYFHANSLQRHRSVRALVPRFPEEASMCATINALTPLDLNFPALEDRESIQIALSTLLSALSQNRIDYKIARTLLYGLQVAATNAAHLRLEPRSVVSSTVTDDEGRQLAPADEEGIPSTPQTQSGGPD